MVDEFLQQPLTARVATNGPTVRPTWYHWEDGAFWILTGPWARLAGLVRRDPAVVRGRAELVPFDVPRGRRKLRRYLGEDETHWDARFRSYLLDDSAEKGTVWLRMRPDSLRAKDLSFRG